MSSRAQKRLLKELKELHDNPLEDANVAPRDGDIMTWVGFIFGPEGTMFEHGAFEILIEFGESYPIIAPKVTFLSEVLHPNVRNNGRIAPQVIESFWRPSYCVWSLLLWLQVLLREPVDDTVFGANSLGLESDMNYQDEHNKGTSGGQKTFDVVNQELQAESSSPAPQTTSQNEASAQDKPFQLSQANATASLRASQSLPPPPHDHQLYDCKTMTTQLSASSCPSTVVQCGPAGSTYKSMRSAGRQLLHTHCDNFPSTKRSFVLPPSSINKFTEPTDLPRANLSKKQEGQLRGMRINQDGERHEKRVSDIFVRMIKQIDVSPPILALKNISIDNDHKCNTRVNALMQEIPGLTFQGELTTGENDMLVFLQNIGIAIIEVKGSAKAHNIESAEQQLKRMNWFIQCIFKGITGDSTRAFPTVKLIVVPSEETSSPTTLTPQGSRLAFKDSCDTFHTYWTRYVTDELKKDLALRPFSSAEFNELTEIVAGVWSSKAVRVPLDSRGKRFRIDYDESNASLSKVIQGTDLQIDTGAITTASQHLTNIIPTQPSDVFQSSNTLRLFYLSPVQRELFASHKQCVLRGAAGTGKTLMLAFKVLELKQTSDFRDILILAPRPHTLRIRNILLKNNHSVEILTKFPPPPSDHTAQLHNTSNIYIMDLNDFFLVATDTLMSYDLTRYHFFVDDLQSLIIFETKTSFYDVGDFIDKWYESSLTDGRYLWVLIDPVQSGLLSDGENEGTVSHFFFLTPQHNPRTFNIPIVHLNHIMRNTTDIAALNNEFRDMSINHPEINIASHILPAPAMGHNIGGQVPTYHRSHPIADEQHILSFIIQRLREELRQVTKPPYSLPLSHIAILWQEAHDEIYAKYIPTVRRFLYREFNTLSITIKEQLNTDNTHEIIMDDAFLNVPSFESPCVILIITDGGIGLPYCSLTRARTHLTIIDARNEVGPWRLKHMNTVLWDTAQPYIRTT